VGGRVWWWRARVVEWGRCLEGEGVRFQGEYAFLINQALELEVGGEEKLVSFCIRIPIFFLRY
jgi:hypothetical protein